MLRPLIDVGEIIKQGAEPHGAMRLGDGKDTIARSGCLLSCLTMAARHCHGDHDLDVLEANRLIREGNGFEGSRLIRSVAAHALGIDVIAWEIGFDTGEVMEALLDGLPVVLGIDYKRGRSSGKSDADHFVVALFCQNGTLAVADPASGTLVTIDLQDPQYKGQSCIIAETMVLGIPH